MTLHKLRQLLCFLGHNSHMSFNFSMLHRSKIWRYIALPLLALLLVAMLSLWLLPVDKLLAQQLRQWLNEQGIALEFDLSTLTASHATLRDIHLKNSSALQLENLDISYSLGSLRRGSAKSVHVSGLRLTLHQTEEGGIVIDGLALPASDAGDKSVALPVLPFDTLKADDLHLIYQPIAGDAITLTAQAQLNGDYTGSFTISEASVPLPEGEALITNLILSRPDTAQPITLKLENIAHLTGKKAYFSPLTAHGSINIARDNDALDGIMTIEDLRHLWRLDIAGATQLKTGEWNIAFDQPAISFESGIIQPDMLFPVLRGLVTQATGATSIKGNARGTADGNWSSEGEIRFEAMSASVKDIPINGLNGTVKLASLWPPATAGEQSLAVDEIVLGLPLRDGRLRFSLAADGTAQFQPSTWKWAQGTLQTGKASVNIYTPNLPDMTLTANHLALEELLAGLLKEGISASGTLNGSIPVHFTKDHAAMITNGKLSADTGGVVRYNPTDESPLQKGGSFQTDLLLGALENFHYEQLSMTINSTDADALQVLLHVKGRNPNLYDGQSIELNINLNGNLFDVIQSGMSIYTLPERLEEQLAQ